MTKEEHKAELVKPINAWACWAEKGHLCLSRISSHDGQQALVGSLHHAHRVLELELVGGALILAQLSKGVNLVTSAQPVSRRWLCCRDHNLSLAGMHCWNPGMCRHVFIIQAADSIPDTSATSLASVICASQDACKLPCTRPVTRPVSEDKPAG